MATRSVPAWGQTGATINTRSTSSGNAFGNISVTGNKSSSTAYGNAYGSSTTNTTTTVSPTYGVTGYRSVEQRVENYHRNFDLYAFNVSNPEQPVFNLTVTSDGYSDDLRKVFPILAYSSTKHIGESTGAKIEYMINDEDPMVNLYIEKRFIHPKVIYKPKHISRSLKHPSVRVLYAQNNKDELILCLYNTENASWHIPAKKSILITENGACPISKIEGTSHFRGGTVSAKARYITLHFYGDLEDVKKANFVEYTDKKQTRKGYEFVGITLAK